MDEPVRIPKLAEMPRVPAAKMEADEDYFNAYLDLVGALVLVHPDGTEDVYMSVPVAEAFFAAEARAAARIAERDSLLAQIVVAEAECEVLKAETEILRRKVLAMQKLKFQQHHQPRHRCAAQRRRGRA